MKLTPVHWLIGKISFSKSSNVWMEVSENAIPVRAIINSKINLMDDKCHVCEKEDSAGHAPMLCNYARATWFGSQWALQSDMLCPL